MKNIKANNQAELFSILKAIDICIPPRRQGRTTEHCERRSICRLLATLGKYNLLDYPVELIKRQKHQPPDFFLRNGNLNIGIEVTEAVNEDYARATTLPEAHEHGTIIDPSLFKWGTLKKTLTELRSIVTRKKLTGPGWEGSSVEIEYANAILAKTLAKTKLLNTHYDKFPENWLLIYCNLTLPMLDFEEANQIFAEKAVDYWSGDAFSRVFVEEHQNINIYSHASVETLSLFNAWMRLTKKTEGDVLNSTPESNPIPQAGKGGNIMRYDSFQFSHLLYHVSRAMGSTLARIYRLCCGIKFSGIGVSLIPGIITCNISFRAGGSGSAHLQE